MQCSHNHHNCLDNLKVEIKVNSKLTLAPIAQHYKALITLIVMNSSSILLLDDCPPHNSLAGDYLRTRRRWKFRKCRITCSVKIWPLLITCSFISLNLIIPSCKLNIFSPAHTLKLCKFNPMQITEVISLT